MFKPSITFYDRRNPGRLCSAQFTNYPAAVAALIDSGYTARFDGADVYDHYDGDQVAVISDANKLANEHFRTTIRPWMERTISEYGDSVWEALLREFPQLKDPD